MKKRMLILLACLLLCAQMTAALANGYRLEGGIYDIVSDDVNYDAYMADADSGNEKVEGRHVNQAILSSRYHSQLIAAFRENGIWQVDTASTTAVYQPGDQRGTSPALRHTEQGFELSYGGSEVYTFTWMDGQYVLTRVSFNINSYYGDSLMWQDDGYLFWQAGLEDSMQPIGDALWRTEQLTLADFNITQLPRSMADVRRMNSVARALGAYGGELTVQETWQPVQDSHKLAVYAAPDENAYRASSGKASVSTGGEMKLLGSYQGWTMVEYAVSLRTSRIGFVHSSLLSFDSELPLPEMPVSLVTARDTFLTDDPHVSQYAQASLPAGTKVQGLALCGAFYAMVSYEGANQLMWGFVPLRDLMLADDDARWDVMDTLIGKWQCSDSADQSVTRRILYSDGSYHGIRMDAYGTWLDDEYGYWSVVDCAADARYVEKVLYEIVFSLESGETYRYGLMIHDDGSISLLDEAWGTWYQRNEYSTYGNG